jgi:putative membrane protein
MRTLHPTLLVAFAAVTLTACAKKDAGTTDTMAARDSASTRRDSSTAGMAHDSAGAAASKSGWSDAQILGYTTAANTGEIAEGKLAQSKARSAGVKAFGRQMVADHQAMLAEGSAFAKKHNVTPDTTQSDAAGLMKDSRDHVKDLTGKQAGADWDKSYLDGEIDGHQKVLDKLQQAANGTTNADLRAMLVKATGKVQEHLTKAKALKEKYPA